MHLISYILYLISYDNYASNYVGIITLGEIAQHQVDQNRIYQRSHYHE